MKLFRDLFSDLDEFGRFWLALGLVSLAAAAAMSCSFGWDVSVKHALFLAVLSVVAAFGPMAAEMLWSRGRKGPAIATALICVPLLGIEFFSHAGFTAGLRGSNIETATVQNTKWDGAQSAVTEDESNVRLWREQLATLLAQNAWAGTVKADGLRAQLAVAQKEIELEAARGGCKSKCALRMKEKADLEQRIATVEQASDLSARIEATQRILDGKRERAATTEHASSAVDHQNKFLIKSVALFVNGSTEASDIQAMGAEQSVNLAMAIAGTGLPAFALFLAGLFRVSRRRDDDPSAPAIATSPVQSETRVAQAETAPAPSFRPQGYNVTPARAPAPTHTREIVRDDRMVWRDLRAALRSPYNSQERFAA